jgi:hypothetical protein
MADLKSAFITNATATPVVLTNSAKSNGVLREASGVVTPAADQADDTIMRVCRVPSNARISQILISAADATTGGAIDIGVYQIDANGGAVVDRDLFASAFALTGGPFDNADVTFESDEYTYAESEDPLWEVLGLSADPNIEYDICAVVETVFNGGPTAIALKVRYVT